MEQNVVQIQGEDVFLLVIALFRVLLVLLIMKMRL